MDEPQRIRIRDDLRGLFKGELLFDDLSRDLYSTDASIFQIQPLGIAVPRDEEDLQLLVRYAAEQSFPLVPRGAGTGMAGGCLGPGLIVDGSVFLRRVLAVEGDTVRVESGITLQNLQSHLEPLGLRWGPDLGLEAMQTVGGLLATQRNALPEKVQDLRLVLDNGDITRTGMEATGLFRDQAMSDHYRDIVHALSLCGEEHESLLASLPSSGVAGYQLAGVWRAGQLDVARLLLGSEGTLAYIAGATLRLEAIPAERALVLAAFDRWDTALEATGHLTATRPTSCELLDRRLLSLMKGNPDLREVTNLFPANAEALLLVSYEALAQGQADNAAQRLLQRLSLASMAFAASEPETLRRLEALRASILPSMVGLPGLAQPLPFVEDVAVPSESVREYVRRLQDIFQEHETTAPLLLDPLTGHVHARPILHLGRAEDRAKLSVLSDKVHELVLALGGQVGGQRGLGLARSSWGARQGGKFFSLLRQIKAIFDPKGIFNPGKIVDPDPAASWPVRTLAASPETPPERNLLWPVQTLEAAANHCNGCGRCRTEAAPQRMCPIFRAEPSEAATPRAKANLLRHLLQNPEPSSLSSDQVRAVADLCVNCKMCALECPAHVPIPKLMLEAKAANVAAHGLDRSEWFLARLEGFARWGSRFRRFVNWLLRIRPGRWLLHKLFGLALRRRLPPLARRTFLREARERGWTHRPTASVKPAVVLFIDLFANYFDPQIAEAAVRVLEHNGHDVIVPAGQVSSGLQALAQGDAEAARDLARRNMLVLAELAREGLPIICIEPSAALMLRQDYLDLVDEADARQIAAQTVEFTSFLHDLHQRGSLRTDFRPLPYALAHHVPCHLKALGPVVGDGLLRLIPDLQVTTLDVSCSGMAGTFGLKEKNYALSHAAGRPMLSELKRVDARFGVTECSSCRLQMEDGAGKRTLHPAQYLALAYGLLPEVEERLAEPIRDLVLR